MNWGTSGTVFQQGGGTNPFSVTSQDPNTNKFPIYYATGRAGIDGNFTVAVEAGFTPPNSFIVWEYNRVASAWFKIGANSGQYEITVDATYAMFTFEVSENAYVLVQSVNVVTGNALMDGVVDFNQVGPPQEGY